MNSTRRELYGPGFSVILLRENGVGREYDEGPEITVDFMVSTDKTGILTFLLLSRAFDTFLETATHIVFKGWVYAFSEPAKTQQGAVEMWKATGRSTGNRYTFEP